MFRVNSAQFMMRLVQLPVSPPGGPGQWSVSGDYYYYEGWHQTRPVTPTGPAYRCYPPLITGCVGQTHSEAASHCPVHANYCKSPIVNVSAQRGRRMLEKKKINNRNSGANLIDLYHSDREKRRSITITMKFYFHLSIAIPDPGDCVTQHRSRDRMWHVSRVTTVSSWQIRDRFICPGIRMSETLDPSADHSKKSSIKSIQSNFE